MASTILSMTFDCADAESLSGFWVSVLGYERMEMGVGDVAIAPPNGCGPPIWFIAVPEPKTAKNRFHLDRESWTAMADPEGNEFCVG